MGTRLKVFLTREEDQILFKLRNADVPQKVKDRAEVIRLNAHGWYVEKIVVFFLQLFNDEVDCHVDAPELRAVFENLV